MSEGEERSQAVLTAAGWGLLSSLSVLLGCFIGLWRLPGRSARAVLMSFGAGALLNAVAVELFGEVLFEQANAPGDPEDNNGIKITLMAVGFGVVGGLLFALVNKLLSDRGGFIRRLNTVRGAMQLLRSAHRRRMVTRLRQVPRLSLLAEGSLQRLSSRLLKVYFRLGQSVGGLPDCGLYLVYSGSIQVTVHWAGGYRKPARSEVFVVGAGSFFGPMGLLQCEGACITAAVALVPSKALLLPAEEVSRLLASPPSSPSLASSLSLQGCVALPPLRGESAHERTADVAAAAGGLWLWASGLLNRRSTERCAAASKYNAGGGGGWSGWGAAGGGVDGDGDGDGDGGSSTASGDSLPSDDASALAALGWKTQADVDAAAEAAATRRPSKWGALREAVLMRQRAPTDGSRSTARGASGSSAASGASSAPPAASRTSAPSLPEATHPADGPSATASWFELLSNLGFTGERLRALPRTRASPRNDGAQNAADASSSDGVPSLLPTPRESSTVGSPPLSRHFESPFGLSRGRATLQQQSHAVSDAAAVARVVGDGGNAGQLGSELRAEVAAHVSGRTAAMVIWLGMCMDGIPESLVIGVLANQLPDEYPSLIGFVAAVALANFPEAMSATATLKACGMRSRTIFLMWFTLFVGTGAGAAIGAAIFPPAVTTEDELAHAYANAAIVGVCGGATLVMVSNNLLPEAFELGGDVVGLSTLMGFLAAILVKSVGIQLSDSNHHGCNSTHT